ncbi:MAG: hypothetical protein RLY93_10485 [Sumerlaeia bacterium]
MDINLIESGLVFAMPLDGNRFSFGQIIKTQVRIHYMAGFDLLKSEPWIDSSEELAMAQVVALGDFFDILLKLGRWQPVGTFECPPVSLPFFKVKIGEDYFVESWDRSWTRVATEEEVRILGFRSHKAPIILENAIKWHFNLEPHHVFFDSLSPVRIHEISRFFSHE